MQEQKDCSHFKISIKTLNLILCHCILENRVLSRSKRAYVESLMMAVTGDENSFPSLS